MASVQTQDSIGSRISPPTFAVADEGMGEEEALDFLTEEERAAIAEDDADESIDRADPGDAGEDSEDNATNEEQSDEDERAEDGEREADGQSPDGEPEAAEPAADDQQAAGEEGDDSDGLTAEGASPEAPTAQPAAQPSDEFNPQYVFDATDLDARQDKLNADFTSAKDIIEKAYNEGEIDEADYHRRRDMLWEIRFKEQSAIDRDRIKAEISAESREQAKSQSWEHALANFMAQNETVRASRALTGAMQAELNALGTDPKTQGLGYAKMLETAKQRVYKEFGLADSATAKPSASAKAKDPVKELVKQRGKKPAIPQTLGDVPSDMSSGGKFDDINSLNGLAFEDAVARMTADELAQWSR